MHAKLKYWAQTFLSEQVSLQLFLFFLQSRAIVYLNTLMKVKCSSMNISKTLYCIRNYY